MKWAPGTTHGHLLEYVRKTNSTHDQSIRLTIDSVLAGASKAATDPTVALTTAPNEIGQVLNNLRLNHSESKQY